MAPTRARAVIQSGIDLLKDSEGVRLTAYQDVVGVWTIGYGWTGPVDGVAIHKGMTITMDKAEALLRLGVERFARDVEAACVTATDTQFAAMVSLAYNIGINAFRRSSVLKHHRRGDHQRAADAFLLWIKAGGKVVKGLRTRRMRERRLYLSDPPR